MLPTRLCLCWLPGLLVSLAACSAFDGHECAPVPAPTPPCGPVLSRPYRPPPDLNPAWPPLANDPPLTAYFSAPAWHPDGEWIATHHSDSLDTDGDCQPDQPFGGIWLIHAQTGERQPLLRGFNFPAWSADGRQLAVERGGQLYTIAVTGLNPARVDNSSLRQLTHEGRNFFPSWSPDGRWIVFDSSLNDPKGANVLWKVRSDGSERTDISEHGVGEWRMPDWSPDGNWIAFQSYEGTLSGAEIAIMDTSGNNKVRLTFDRDHDQFPKFSPDGFRVAYYAQPIISGITSGDGVWVINIDGSNRRQVSPDHTASADWSPDGGQIVFVYANAIDRTAPGNRQLWLVNADGTGLRQLTHFNEPVAPCLSVNLW